MSVKEIYDLILYCVTKNKQQGYVSPDDFNLVINQAQRSYLDYLLGQYQKYQIRRPISIVEFGQNQRLRDSVSPLIYGRTLNVYNNGVSPFPSDYEYTDAMWTGYGHYNIRFVQQDRLDSYVHSSIDPIDTNPIYLINHEGFQFFPENIGLAKLSYVRTPPTIKYAYTLDGNGRQVYDPINSINPVWAETDILNIIVRALQIVGISLQSGTVVQYSQEIKNGGQ
jgi:hypothetical protein